MSNRDQETVEAALPPELLERFEDLKHRLAMRRTLLTASTGVGGLMVSFLALFALDRVTETTVAARWLIFIGGVLSAAISLGVWVAGRVRRGGEQRRLAMLVQRRHPALGDRLLGIVELASGNRIPDGMSPALCRAAIRQVAAEAVKSDFSRAVDWRRARIAGGIAAGVGVVVVGVWVVAFDAGRNSFQRWIAPGATIARYTFVSVEGLAARRVVAHGEPFEVRVKFVHRAFWKPSKAEAQLGGQYPVAGVVSNGVVTFKFGGLTEAAELTVRSGDARGRMGVVPVTRPSLRSMEAGVKLPGYLELGDQVVPVSSGALTFVKGSLAAFRGELSRAVTNVTVVLGGVDRVLKRREGAHFETDFLALDDQSEVQFQWLDEDGLSGSGPWRLNLQEIPDEAPRASVMDLSPSSALLVTEVLDIRVMAQDDYGVKEASLKWESTSADGPVVSSGDMAAFVARPGGTGEKQFEHGFRFSPVLLGIKEDSVVELRARATDRFPGRVPSESTVYRIFVVSPERHAELVRQHLESILTRVEDVTRQEESLMKSTQDLASRKDIESAEAASKAAELAEQQDINSRNLEEITKDGAQVLREAMRNSTFSQQTLREWTKNLAEMKKVAQQQMQQAKAALQQAKADASQRSAQAKTAAEKEEESLRALERMQKRMNTGLDNLQAMTLAQRLKRLANEETRFESNLLKMAPDTIGLLPEELTARQRAQQSEVADDQIEVQTQAMALQAEISRFFDRTQNGPYGEVSKEMADSRITQDLERISGLIRSNIVMDASQDLGGWSKRLSEWASRLEPKSEGEESSAASASGDSPSPDEAMMKQLMALLRLRDRQATALSMTQLLDKQRAEDAAYRDKARVLAATQGQISGDFRQVRVENRLPNLAQAYDDTFQPIQASAELLSKPQTDGVTQKAEQSAVEQLTDLINLINELTQNGPKSQSGASEPAEAEAEMMMQMAQQQGSTGMSMEAKDNPGPNSNGGTTNRRGEPFKGSAQGKAANARTNQRIGADTKNFPVEFRQALENYFRALEKEGLQ